METQVSKAGLAIAGLQKRLCAWGSESAVGKRVAQKCKSSSLREVCLGMVLTVT